MYPTFKNHCLYSITMKLNCNDIAMDGGGIYTLIYFKNDNTMNQSLYKLLGYKNEKCTPLKKFLMLRGI